MNQKVTQLATWNLRDESTDMKAELGRDYDKGEIDTSAFVQLILRK